jgi:hypothetical protein
MGLILQTNCQKHTEVMLLANQTTPSYFTTLQSYYRIDVFVSIFVANTSIYFAKSANFPNIPNEQNKQNIRKFQKISKIPDKNLHSRQALFINMKNIVALYLLINY